MKKIVDIVINEIYYAITVLYQVLTDYNNYEKIEANSLYFLSGCFFTITVSSIGYFRVLNQFPEKKELPWNG